MNWRYLCEIGWQRFDGGRQTDFWVRWTCPDGFYWWLHPSNNWWVTEPEQISMPTWPTRQGAIDALQKAPPPPGAEIFYPSNASSPPQS